MDTHTDAQVHDQYSISDPVLHPHSGSDGGTSGSCRTPLAHICTRQQPTTFPHGRSICMHCQDSQSILYHRLTSPRLKMHLHLEGFPSSEDGVRSSTHLHPATAHNISPWQVNPHALPSQSILYHCLTSPRLKMRLHLEGFPSSEDGVRLSTDE